MEIIFHYIAGCILFVLGMSIMLWGSYYGGLVWKKEAPPSLLGGLVYAFGFWLIFFSIRLFGASVALSMLITILCLAICGYITSIIVPIKIEKEKFTIDNIIMTLLYIFFAAVMIVGYWYAKVMGIEADLEAFFESVFKK